MVGSLGVSADVTSSVGFDIAARGTGFATFDADTGAGVNTRLYTVDLLTGAATLVGTVCTGAAADPLAVLSGTLGVYVGGGLM